MSLKTRYVRLYKQIPSFKCIDGCTDCCGYVPISAFEAEKLGLKEMYKLIPTINNKCQFAQSGKCEKYDQRPFMCRLFGAADNPGLTCPYGCGPSQKLTSEKAIIITDEYLKLI